MLEKSELVEHLFVSVSKNRLGEFYLEARDGGAKTVDLSNVGGGFGGEGSKELGGGGLGGGRGSKFDPNMSISPTKEG